MDKRAVHSFGSNLKSLFIRLKSLFFQAAVLLVFRKCRKRQCLEAIFSTSMTHQGLKLTWIFRECVKNLFYKRKDKFLSNVYWEMFIILMFSCILAVATGVARLLLPLLVFLYMSTPINLSKCEKMSQDSRKQQFIGPLLHSLLSERLLLLSLKEMLIHSTLE